MSELNQKAEEAAEQDIIKTFGDNVDNWVSKDAQECYKGWFRSGYLQGHQAATSTASVGDEAVKEQTMRFTEWLDRKGWRLHPSDGNWYVWWDESEPRQTTAELLTKFKSEQ